MIFKYFHALNCCSWATRVKLTFKFKAMNLKDSEVLKCADGHLSPSSVDVSPRITPFTYAQSCHVTLFKVRYNLYSDIYSTYLCDLSMWGAGISPVVSIVTGSVLQAEAGLVALCHWPMSGGIQQIVVAELIHAVVVPVDQQHSDSNWRNKSLNSVNFASVWSFQRFSFVSQ